MKGFLFAVLLTVGANLASAAEEAPRMLSHDVYFTLKDHSPEAREALVAGCKKFLAKHPGIVWFAAGALVEEHEREVNDRAFDVALHVVFQDKASHDKYQDAEAHHKFIEEFSAGWEKVRVFDSWLTATSHGEDEKQETPAKSAETLQLPDAATGFAGLIEGKIVAKTDRGAVVAVAAVPKIWETSKAKDANVLVGKKVLVTVNSDGRYGQRVRKFVEGLKVGEKVQLDVAHREGESLVILELTDEQRRRAPE